VFNCLLLVISFAFTYPAICYSVESPELDSIIEKAENGDAYYQGVLGSVYRRGESGETDYAKAYQWLKLSADQGHPIGMYNLAVLYESGLFVARDTALANELYARAYRPMLELAEQGNLRAQVNLGYLLEIGVGVDENLQAALRWYEKAANNGDPRAQYLVGYKYYYGWGYEQDYAKAMEWFSKAADQDYSAAQHFLGNMYANGIGASVSYDKAMTYHRKAEQFSANKESVSDDSLSYILNGIKYEGDKVIPGLLPPKFKYDIAEGSCGESCIWSLVNSDEFVVSQIEINKDGGNPGRGLHSNELYKALDKYNFEYTDNLKYSYLHYALSFLNPVNLFSDNSEDYKKFLYDVVIEKIKQGIPVILGIKIYPDKHFFWGCDHFILLVGYNEETNEIIYNDFNQRKRIRADKLLDKTEGYSIINRYNFLHYLEIKNY